MFRMIPDIDLLDATLASQEDDWVVITLRGIGEMGGDRSAAAPKQTGQLPSWMDLSDQTDQNGMRRAWVNLLADQDDMGVWADMDKAALDLANALANNDPSKIKVIQQKRDGLGTTHHEAGTLWLGTDPSASVTDLSGRFHHIKNAYVAGPALFPAIGSANPSLTALALARRSAAAIVTQSLGAEPDFLPLGSGGLAGWRMLGAGGFIELGGNIIEAAGGIGLLWFPAKQFKNFVLRLEWQAFSPSDNSGIFVRFPDPGSDLNIPINQGYEVQIDNTGRNPEANTFDDPLHNTGAVYKLAPSNAAPALGQWHTFEIQANAATLTVLLDGQQVSQLQNANRSPQGHIGLQNHHAGSRVQFRRLRIKELP
jgi:hypothetical protein